MRGSGDRNDDAFTLDCKKHNTNNSKTLTFNQKKS